MTLINFIILSFIQTGSGAPSDSLIVQTQSKFNLWLSQVTSAELILPFLESVIIFIGGVVLAYLFYKRSINMQKKDHLQTRALLLASLALLLLSTKGLFFLIGSLSLIGLLPEALFSNIYWLGWQISLLWFLCFAHLFSLSFIRSKKSYDIYFITGFIFFFTFLTIFYNDTLLNKSFFKLSPSAEVNPNDTLNWMPEGHLSKSTFLEYALDIHIAIWIYLFLSTAYQLFKKSKRYQNESSRQASFIMSGAYFGIGFLGIISFILHFQKSSLFIPLSYVITILIMGLFYYSVQNIYKHGRYKRF